MKNYNVPEGYELFILPVGKRKVTVEPHSSRSATFTIEREDHSIGNLLKGQLLTYPNVTFAGYIMPHPLDHCFNLNVQTISHLTPTKAMQLSIQHLIKTIKFLENKFSKDASKIRAIERCVENQPF